MSYFGTTLKQWLAADPKRLLTEIASLASIPASDLSRIRNGKRRITLRAITQLLPVIESQSNRADACRMLEAYLRDETPDSYADDMVIKSKPQDESSIIQETPPKVEDPIKARAMRWLRRAQRDPEFDEWWKFLDKYLPQ